MLLSKIGTICIEKNAHIKCPKIHLHIIDILKQFLGSRPRLLTSFIGLIVQTRFLSQDGPRDAKRFGMSAHFDTALNVVIV